MTPLSLDCNRYPYNDIGIMETKQTLEQLNRELEDVRGKLLALGPIHPGSISTQYHACGNPSCRCHDPVDPKKHGPYNKLTYSHAGRSTCRFVREECAEQLRQRLDNYKTFRALTAKWIELSIQAGTIEFFPKSHAASTKRPSAKS